VLSIGSPSPLFFPLSFSSSAAAVVRCDATGRRRRIAQFFFNRTVLASCCPVSGKPPAAADRFVSFSGEWRPVLRAPGQRLVPSADPDGASVP
jgi:hypothetical protein